LVEAGPARREGGVNDRRSPVVRPPLRFRADEAFSRENPARVISQRPSESELETAYLFLRAGCTNIRIMRRGVRRHDRANRYRAELDLDAWARCKVTELAERRVAARLPRGVGRGLPILKSETRPLWGATGLQNLKELICSHEENSLSGGEKASVNQIQMLSASSGYTS
jgi:hypothetical protein